MDLIDALKFLTAKDAYRISMTSNWAMRETIESSKKLECLEDVKNLISECATIGELGVSVRQNVVAPDSFALQSAFTTHLVLPELVMPIARSLSVNNEADTAC